MLKISWTFLFQVFVCFLFFTKATGLETFITSEVSPLFGKSLVHNGKSIVPCHIFRPDRKTAFLQFLYATYEVIPSFNHSTNISQLNFLGVGLINQMDQSSTRIHVSLASDGKEIYRLSVPYKTTSNYTEATSLGKFRWFTSPESRIFEVKVSFPLQDLYLPKYDKNKVLPAGVYDVEVYVRNTKKDEERSCIRIHRAFTVHPVTIPVKLSLMSPVIGNPLIAGNLSFPFQSWDRVYVDISNNTRNVTFLPKLIPIDSIPFDYFAENSTLTFNLHRTGSFERVMPNNETVLHLLDPLSDGCNDIHSVNLTFISQTVGYFVMPYCADSRWELSYTFPDNYHRIETVFYAVESSTKLDETVYHANLLLTSPQGLNPINQTIYAMYIALQSAVPSLQLPYNSSYIDLFTVASEAVQGVMIDPTARASLNQLSNLTSENSSFYISSALVEEIAFIEQLKWSNFYEVPVNQEAVVFIDGNFSQRRLDSSSSLEIVFPSLFNKRIEEKKINKKNMHTIHTEGSISSSSDCVVSDFIDILQQTANAVHQLERANKKIDEMFIQLKILERLLKLNKIPSWKYYTMYAKINAKVTISYAVVGVCLKSVYLLIQRAIEMYQESCYVLCDLNQDYVPYSSSGICNSPFYLFWYQDIQHINVDVNGCFAQSFPNISYQIRYLLSGPFSLISRVLSYLPEGLRDKFKVNELQNLVNNFFYQPPRESVEITRHNIVQGYSENHFCDFNNWPFISCDCSLLSEEYLERIENNVNLNIGIAYKMSSYLPAVKKIFPIYLQPAAPVYSPTAAPVFISSSPTTLQPTYSTLIPAALVLTSPNADAGTYNHYPVSGNVDVFVRSDNNYVIYWTTFCGGSWRTKEGLYELSDYVVPGGKWYGGGFWYPAFLCDANKAAGKYDLNTIWFSSGCSMSFSY